MKKKEDSLSVSMFLHNVYQMLLMAWKAHPPLFVALTSLKITQGIIPVVVAWLFKRLIDLLTTVLQSSGTTDFMSGFIPILIIYIVVTALAQALQALQQYLQEEMTRQTQFYVETLFYREVNRLHGLRHFESPAFHDTMRMAQRSLHSGPNMMMWTLTGIIESAMSVVGFFGVLLVLSPLLAFLVVIAALPQLVAQLKIGRQRYRRDRWETPKGRKSYYLGSLLSEVYFVKEIRLFNLQNHFLNDFLKTMREVNDSQRQQARRELGWRMGLDVLNGIVTGVALVLVFRQAFLNLITLGDVTLYITAVRTVQMGVSSIVQSIAHLNEYALYFSSFVKLKELPNDIPEPQHPQPVPQLKHGIELRNVSFRYTPEANNVLDCLNLTIPAGKTVALVGVNGAGKTTLVKLLARLYDPDEGQLLWDGTDLRDFAPDGLRERMGAIFQDFVQYDLTARENIGLGRVQHIDDLPQIQRVAETARVAELIAKMPEGYETVLSRWLVEEDEQGNDLSGGQWQKMAIARMYMREAGADLLILDEPTANLDAEAEYEIYSQFATLVKNRTALLISHRFSTVRMADLVAVLDGGKITEYGTHEELIALGGTYARLYGLQAGQYA